MWVEQQLVIPAIIANFRNRQFMAGLACLLAFGSAWAQSAPEPDALVILQNASQQYVHLKTYDIVEEETFTSEHPPDPSPTTIKAIEAPGGRSRFEADIGLGNDIQVSDGHFVWFYLASQNSYSRRDVREKNTTDSKSNMASAHLRDSLAQFAADYKSAQRLSDETLVLGKHSVECYVIELSNDDLKTPRPYPFTEAVWIEKGSLKIRKTAENYIVTLQRPGKTPFTYPARRTALYPEVSMNETVQASAFQFIPPAQASLVSDFPDLAQSAPETRTMGRQVPNIILRAGDGSRVRIDSFRGHPLLIDLWATWCTPCIAGFLDLARLYHDTRTTELAIVSIDLSDDATVAQSYLVKMHYPWPNFHDHGEVDSAFGVYGLPRTVLLDEEGKVVFDRVSPTAKELRGAISKLGAEYEKAVADRR